MTDRPDRGDVGRFAHWSGYGPGKPDDRGAADAGLIPLNRQELRAEALRFRRGAEAAAADGDGSKAEMLRRAADDLDRRAEAADKLR